MGRGTQVQRGHRIGVDVGGTFTDLICVTPDGSVVLDKTPTTLDDQSLGVMTGLGQLAETFGTDLAGFCASIDTVVHGTTTADNTMIEQDGAAVGPARHRGPPRRDRDASRAQGADLGSVLPGPVPHRPAPLPHPHPRADRLRRHRAARARRGRGARRCSPLAPARRRVAGRDVPVQLRQPRPRTTGAGDHPRGVPRGGARLAEPRGHAARPRVRAHVHHARQRVRGAAECRAT